MSFDSTRKKQGPVAPAKSAVPAGKRSSAKGKRALRSTIEEYILEHCSQNHSPKTIEWHTLVLGNFAAFLEKQGVTFIEDIERVNVLSWLTNLRTEPGAKGKKLSERSVNCYLVLGNDPFSLQELLGHEDMLLAGAVMLAIQQGVMWL